MINKKYTVTEKNGGCVPIPPIIGNDEYGRNIYDERVLYVEIPCGQCIECRQAKAREWTIRLNEELHEWKYKYMITLTFEPKELAKILKERKIEECNAAVGYAVRHSLEYWRKDHKKSLRHWYISEMGHDNSERIHAHGIIFCNEPLEYEKIERSGDGWRGRWKYWKYGMVHVGDYCTERTVNYIVKYVTKIDNDHKGFIGQIFASPGIGKRFLEHQYSQTYKYRPGDTKGYYTLNNGAKVKLPVYYKNKLHNEDERELIWRDFMDEKKQTIAGNTYPESLPGATTQNILNKAQEVNKFNGYGDDSQEWRKKPYNITRRMLEHNEEWKREKIRKKRQSIMAQMGIGVPGIE